MSACPYGQPCGLARGRAARMSVIGPSPWFVAQGHSRCRSRRRMPASAGPGPSPACLARLSHRARPPAESSHISASSCPSVSSAAREVRREEGSRSATTTVPTPRMTPPTRLVWATACAKAWSAARTRGSARPGPAVAAIFWATAGAPPMDSPAASSAPTGSRPPIAVPDAGEQEDSRGAQGHAEDDGDLHADPRREQAGDGRGAPAEAQPSMIM